MHRTILSFVQPQPNSIQNKNNPIGCGTAPGNLVLFKFQRGGNKMFSVGGNFHNLFGKRSLLDSKEMYFTLLCQQSDFFCVRDVVVIKYVNRNLSKSYPSLTMVTICPKGTVKSQLAC